MNPELAATAAGTRRRAGGRNILFGTLALLLIAGMAGVLTALVLGVQAGVTAYIVGEGHWSKAQQEAVHALYRYSVSGRSEDLARAREALAVPLGDHAARLALERVPRDVDAARQGFLAGRNAPEDVDRMIWMFRWFSTAPYFGDAVAIWREADAYILELATIADRLEQLWHEGAPHGAEVVALRDRIDAIDAVLRPLEIAFSQTLAAGARWMRVRLLIFSCIAFLGMAALAAWVLVTTQRRIRRSESRFRLVFHKVATGMASLDAEGRFIKANPALQGLLGASDAELRGRQLRDMVDPPDAIDACGGSGEAVECRLRRADGHAFWARVSATEIQGAGGSMPGGFVIVEDATEARQQSERLLHLANHDELTGLVNRRETERRLAAMLEQARRGDRRHALCFIDLDDFKRINDTCGHAAGDELLRRLPRELRNVMRPDDALGRLGGDEFAAMLNDISIDQAEQVADKLRRVVEAFRFVWEGHEFRLSCSIGVVAIDVDCGDVSSLLRAADHACYRAKRMGRNQVAGPAREP
ncbi:MAG TPA: sensor domain-containing diguanylate cyclase [Xanthomonadaceae bacterium]|nr:sensor domain-containing diguanylate cyclase [Xanthomonadaceae bacterium]